MAICGGCSGRATCLDGDPSPRGVIRAGIAFSDTGIVFPPCPTCGYPQPGASSQHRDRCPNCDVPTLSRWRGDIQRWAAQGVSDRQAGARLGATAQQIKDARRPRTTTPHERTAA
jgi:hypothetical protein